MLSHRGPWTKVGGTTADVARRLTVHRDEVLAPDGSPSVYEWVETHNLVRVAALVDGELLLVDQYHYLIGTTMQLPGGGIDPGESDEHAGRRELREETGYHGGTWRGLGFLCPLPGLTPARVYLWYVEDPIAGPAELETFERDLLVRTMTPAAGVDAIAAGQVRCAASAALILAVHAGAVPAWNQ